MITDNQIQSILERNKRVEQDKRWETSWMRRISIAVITWLLAALVPTGGYILSTLSASPI